MDASFASGYVFGEARRPGPMDADGGAGVGVVLAYLPDDILAGILRRLRAHSLARCRCVCAAWRGLVDASELLRPHALPRVFPGFFANVRAKPWRPGPGFLPPPASRAPAAVDRLAFLRPYVGGETVVQHQCDGLVLCFRVDRSGEPTAGFVCNPTTERWASLPHPPTRWPGRHDGLFLSFDPAKSPEYEVFLLPVPCRRGSERDGSSSCLPETLLHVTLGMFVPTSFGKHQEEPEVEGKELPLLVFSSATGRWRRQQFAPGRCATARLYDRVMRRRRRLSDDEPWMRTWRSAVYSRGALYAHCEEHILVVLRCSKGTYDSVKLPARGGAVASEHYAAEPSVLSGLPVECIFSSTDDRVLLRYASVAASRVKVWALQESVEDGQLSWTLTHNRNLAPHARMLPLLHDAPSNLAAPEEEGGNGRRVWFSDEDAEEVAEGGGCSRGRWSWDDASLLDMEVGEDELLGVALPPFSILGCHPSQEVVYLAAGAFHVVAYHVGSGKVQYLGRVTSLGEDASVDGVFPYSPCIVDALQKWSCPFPSLKSANKSR